MPLSPGEVIDKCRSEYVTRLLNRNPLLHFNPTATRFDANDIFEGVTANAPTPIAGTVNAVTAVSHVSRLIEVLAQGKRARVVGPNRTVSAKCSKIKLVSTDIQRMSGQQSLFIGYPLLYAEADGKVPILAPLFLIPVTISSVSATAIEFSGGSVRLNPLLPEWCKLYQDIKISTDSQSLADFMTDDEEPFNPIRWRQMTTALLHPWIGVEGIEGVGDVRFDSAPSVKILKELQSENKQAHVLNSAVLGIARFNGQALLDDLTRLVQTAALGQNLMSLVAPRQERHQPSAACLPDSKRWSVIDTDPTQDQAIAQTQISPCLVIQGPPGTGKSQTIVNMISQALASGEAVAVFCEKRSALEVVKKRMEANGLGELCQLIDDPIGQRQAIITTTREIQRDLGGALLSAAPGEHSLKSTNIESLERKIDARMAAFFRSEEPMRERYADLRCRLTRLSKPQGHEVTTFQKIRLALAEDCLDISLTGETALFLRKVQAWQEQAESCEFNTSPWRALRTDIDVDFNSFQLWLEAIKAHWYSAAPLPPRALYWLNTHPISAAWSGTFLGASSRDALAMLNAAAAALHRFKTLTGFGPKTSQAAAELLHAKMSTEFMAPCWQETLGQAGDVHALSRELAEDKVGALLRLSYGHESIKWLDIVKAAIFENMLERLERETPGVYLAVGPLKTDIHRLGELLDGHKESSRLSVKRLFQSRLAPMQVLKDRELLRLRGNSASGRKKSELRDLYGTAGFESMRKLHPVLLSTPEIACALLPLKAGLFDLVIVDEASQMFVAEALPLLFRGKRVVIAGDAKQMPPSDFFTADASDGWDGEEVDDLASDDSDELRMLPPTAIPALDGESVLEAAEAALAAGSPAQRMLEMHYRSAFAELIEFSNHAFYEGRLLAPPGNPAAKAVLPKPITFYQVHGTFLKGINSIEAAEIVRFLSTLWQAENSPSVGVIVMNVVQRDHINNLLQGQAQDDMEFAERLEQERNRKNDGEDIGFFVRSVEHVQGDERDLIVFGTTYAGDSRQFGPISKTPRGRRRLNVAVTRARKGMAVFSSLNVSHMASDADKGNDRWYFQQYLRYAEAVSNGDGPKVNSLLEMLNPRLALARSAAMFESPFEEEVAAFLAKNGYESEPQKPESEFRIDLAVKRRDGLGYICGIECDGAQFHADWRARSRDIWRQRILESKGWHIERVWSTDWFRNPDNTKSKLVGIIRRIESEVASGVVPHSFQPQAVNDDGPATTTIASRPTTSTDAPKQSIESLRSIGVRSVVPTAEVKEVQIGDTVTFKYSDELMPRHVKIVPLNQPCDRASGIIWPRDPLALALIGAVVGDIADVSLPTGRREAEILEIQ